MPLREGGTMRLADLADGQAFGRSGGALAAVTVLTQTQIEALIEAADIDYPGSGPTYRLDSDGAFTQSPNGTYTPTRSAEANLDSNVTPSSAVYFRVGNRVFVSGQFSADPTLAATATSFELTLPIASNLGAVADLSGVAVCGAIAGMSAAITGSIANNTAVFSWISSDVAAQSWSYTFAYSVI